MQAFRLPMTSFLLLLMFLLLLAWAHLRPSELRHPAMGAGALAGDVPTWTVWTFSEPFRLLSWGSILWSVFLSFQVWAARKRHMKTCLEVIRLETVNEELRDHLNGLEEESVARTGLTGLLPICSACKKIRDDRGVWNQLECYIGERSPVEFTHSICPDCAKRLYPDLFRTP